MIRTVIKYTDNKILLNDAEVFETSKELFPGIYEIETDTYGAFKNFVSLEIPKAFPLMPSDELQNLEDYINNFLSDDYENLCKEARILKKSGILLYGKQGIGKSNYINYIINKCLEEKQACIFSCTGLRDVQQVNDKLKELRNIQNTLFVVLLEEMDEILNSNANPEGTLKNFMDGINSVDNCLFLATTNYIDKIPKSLTERPSRFKKVLEIKPTENIEELKKWLTITYKNFIPDLSNEECEHLHDMCINKSIDEIKHIIIDYKMGIENLEKPKKLGFKKQ
jgi:SpoVK/Ycf46/Vps4 family AAA+-type ATPase